MEHYTAVFRSSAAPSNKHCWQLCIGIVMSRNADRWGLIKEEMDY
jgi:hypothetical protein